MQAIKIFKDRCQVYQNQQRITAESTALDVYTQCHNQVYSQVDYMRPDQPPSVEMLAITIKGVCRGDSHYTYVFEQVMARYIDLMGDIGVSPQVIFYYVSNAIISLLVLNRKNSYLSSEILIKIIQRFNFRDATLRAGLEVMAEEVLRRCFAAINESNTCVSLFNDLAL